jgi:hypothetical protein
MLYTFDDFVDNGAYYSSAFPTITGQPEPRIPRFGIFEAATFQRHGSAKLELFFDVGRESENGITIGESHYSIAKSSDPPAFMLIAVWLFLDI